MSSTSWHVGSDPESLRRQHSDSPEFSNRMRRIEVESQVNLPSSCEIEFTDGFDPVECGLEWQLVEVRAVTGDDAAGEASSSVR